MSIINNKFDEKTVYILDSYGLIFRCYFAFISRPLTNSKGENVSAIFGFFRNLHYILQHYKPGYIFAAMDSKTKTFRHEMYDQYKATRNKTPEDLHAQIPIICEILEALGIPVLQCDGYEADDVIATVAKKCSETGRGCRILSGDKDLMQLVSETTQILKPETGASTWKVTGIEGVEAEWGVKPEKLLDLLSLYGDTADNIPGVRGIGVKTASKLLNDYGDLDGIYAHIENLKGATKQKLIEGKENAYFSQKLVKLCDEVPCSDIDNALNSTPINFNFANAATVLQNHEVSVVAKQYFELSLKKGETQNNSINEESNAKTNTASFSNNEQTEFSENDIPLAANVNQNDTSNYKAILSKEELDSYLDKFLKSSDLTIAYDSETTGLNTLETNIIGFSLCYEENKGVYIPLQQQAVDLFDESNYIEKNDAFECLKKIFFNKDVTVVMHNAKFDIKVLFSNGFFNDSINKTDFDNYATLYTTILSCKIYDTMIAAWLINPERNGRNGYSLEYLAETQLGLKGIDFADLVSKNQTFLDVPLDKATSYAAEDVDFTLKLYKKQQPFLNKELFDLEMKVLPILAGMETKGIHIDTKNLNSYNEELTRNIALIEQNIYKEVGHNFNIASPKQLQEVLFEERHLKPGKKTKRGYSTDTSVLEELALIDPVPRMILEYRELAKLQSTYVDSLPKLCDKNDRIHTDFIQTGTATGRLSSREPNLQNIPIRNEAGRKIRSAFTAPEGKVLISADYAQIELVVLAHLSGDKNMCEAFINGIDVHKSTAALIYGVSIDNVTPEMRRTAKVINFGVIYGMSAFRLAQDLGISRTQAASFIENYFKMYSSVNSFIQNTIQNAEQTGFIQTILGRKRPILNINSKNKVEKSAAERIAINSPVQGSAADIVKKAMCDISEELRKTESQARLLLQVHDELIFECPDDEKIIKETIEIIKNKMENCVKLNVPLRVSVEYGKNWGEFH